jgi:molybdopterin synthase catalytic subunit
MIDITGEDFSIEEIINNAKRRDAGAVVSFLGMVRDDDILGMEIESYKEVACEELKRIREEALNKFGLLSVDIIHRAGRLSIGDNIVIIVCCAPHRRAAFRGCEYIIEEIKTRVPIWKKEVRKDGERWI